MAEQKKGPPQVVHVTDTLSGGLSAPGQGPISHEQSMEAGIPGLPPCKPVTPQEVELIRGKTGITDHEVMQKVKEIAYNATVQHNARNLKIMNSKLKEAVLIERHRACHYIETVATYMRVNGKDSVPLEFLKKLASDLQALAHHDERSGAQFVFVEDTLNVDELDGKAHEVANRLVKEG